MTEKGRLFVLSGPSGAGKSTIVSMAIGDRKDVCFSTSVTTRKPRPGEIDGKDYFFIDSDAFQHMVEADELLEHAQYVSNCYGTPKKFVLDQLEAGINVILDIEVQGARQVKSHMPDAVMIFIVPPSSEELKNRLTIRGTESTDTIQARVDRAKREYEEADFYDYIIINDSAENASKELSAIMLAEHCRFCLRKEFLK